MERSPQTNQPTEQWNSSKQAQDPDPCSPTLGTAQTPMKISGVESWPKDLRPKPPNPSSPSFPRACSVPENTFIFWTGPAFRYSVIPRGPVAAFESDWTPLQTGVYQSTETTIASQNTDKPSRDPETLRSSGSKFNRQKAYNKGLGKSPLTILQDDNSPGTLTLWQGKWPSPLSENGKDLKDGAVLETGRFLKTEGVACEQSQGHDEESQHFALMES